MAYIIHRLIQALIVLILTTAMVFVILHLLPGDPVLLYLTQEQYSSATEEEIKAIRKEFGLDRPLHIQYVSWIGDLLQGDMGKSIVKRQPVTKLVTNALPITLYLGILSFIFSNAAAIPVGIICAARRGKWIDTILTILANIGITAPTFWVGILMIYIFGVWLNWLPIHGYTPIHEDFWLSIRKAIMPVFCMSLFPLAGTVRLTRSSMLEVIRKDYIRTAWSKGLSERVIIYRHAVKNGIIPVFTMAGMSVGLIFGGQVFIETVFAIPGMGKLAVDAIMNRDYPTVQGVVLIVAVVVILSNLTVDILYSWFDPRVRLK